MSNEYYEEQKTNSDPFQNNKKTKAHITKGRKKERKEERKKKTILNGC